MRRCMDLFDGLVRGPFRRLLEWRSPPPAVFLEQEPLDELLDLTPPPRFELGDPAMLEHLKEHGYAVVGGVLTVAEVHRAHDLMWDFLSAQAGLRRRSPSTWTDERLGKIGQMFTGIVNSRGAGQSELSWFIRTNPRVQSIFEGIWGTPELITSFDGFNIFRPWHAGFLRTMGGWFHVDQGKTQLGFRCVQGMVSLLDQGPATGGLVVIPGSQHRHEDVLTFAKTDVDFVEPPDECAVLQSPRRLVSCRAGDMILWDSRCLHCNMPAVRMPDRPRNELLRAVVYVCMTPRSWADPKDLEKRRKGYEMNLTSSHWPHRNVMGFGWVKAPPLCYETAGPERQRLIG